MSSERFDVIVIGAGPSGLTSAYCLAKKGFKVLVIERGEEVGSKNLYGGRIYSWIVKKIFPDFHKEAPIERWVRCERLTFMTEDDALTLEFKLSKESQNSFTAYLTSFTKWLSTKAENEGALILTGNKVDELFIEDGKFSGVVIGSEKILADVIVDAEGVNRVLARKVGIASELSPESTSIAVREVIKMSSNLIEDRFQLSNEEGVAQLFIGYPTKGLTGGGFMYTNKETVTLGIVIKLSELMREKLPVHELIEDFRLHPFIKEILKDGHVIEYGAHLIVEETMGAFKPYGNGLLIVGDAAGFCINTGLTKRGVDYAMETGYIAAEAIEYAHNQGKYDEETLGTRYEELLRNSITFRDFKAFKNAPKFLSNRAIYNAYPTMLCRFFKELYSVDGEAKKFYPTLRKSMKQSRVSVTKLLFDAFKAIKTL